jgi:hypothetical protein
MATLWKVVLALVVAVLALIQADRIEAQELFVTPSERVTRFVNVRELCHRAAMSSHASAPVSAFL